VIELDQETDVIGGIASSEQTIEIVFQVSVEKLHNLIIDFGSEIVKAEDLDKL
jgi:hypothetical protein